MGDLYNSLKISIHVQWENCASPFKSVYMKSGRLLQVTVHAPLETCTSPFKSVYMYYGRLAKSFHVGIHVLWENRTSHLKSVFVFNGRLAQVLLSQYTYEMGDLHKFFH